MKILAIERAVAGVADDAFAPLLREEAQAVWKSYQSGAIREMYFRADERAAVLVLECEDEAAARQELSKLPLVREGLIAFEVIPLVAYPGFGRLFDRG